MTNLRAATHAENVQNSKNRGACLKGVVHLPSGRYQAQIKIRGRSYYLGVFADEHEAHLAYMAVAKIHFGEFARAA